MSSCNLYELRVWGQNLRRCERLGVRLTWLADNLLLATATCLTAKGEGKIQDPFMYCIVLYCRVSRQRKNVSPVKSCQERALIRQKNGQKEK